MSEEHPVVGDSADPLIGTVLAERYRIEKRLGEGGMGAVYLARHVILEKIVALKILHDEYARRRELVERFLHEAKAASRIRHEHVIDITDFGETATKNVFFAMEFLDGHDLATEIDRTGFLAWPRVKSIILQLCAALQAAHEAGVIHRDLKPENIYLIERLGNPDFVKVLDFGVAKLTEIEEGRRLTRTGMVFGTPEYMSPEQARGEKPDPRVDVYATGCILFELLTGDVPFHADNFMGVLTKHLFDPLPQLADRSTRTDLPPGLQDVISQALAKDKNQRFNSMNELAVALDTLDNTEGVVYHATSSERSRRHGTPASPVPPERSAPNRDLVDRTGPASRARTTPAFATGDLEPFDDERTVPRGTAPPAGLEVADTQLAVPRRRGRGLTVIVGLLVAAGVGVGALMNLRGTTPPAPPAVRPDTPTTVALPSATAQPAPAAPTPPSSAVAPPPAATPDAAAVAAVVAVPDAAVPAAVEAAPTVVIEPHALLPARPATRPTRRPPPIRDKDRHRPLPHFTTTPAPPASEPAVTPPSSSPSAPSSPGDPAAVPKSDLKDPFRKR